MKCTKAALEDKAIRAAVIEIAEKAHGLGFEAAFTAAETCLGAADEQACAYGVQLTQAAEVKDEQTYVPLVQALYEAFARYATRMRNEACEGR